VGESWLNQAVCRNQNCGDSWLHEAVCRQTLELLPTVGTMNLFVDRDLN
jgi:hypothetical protein